MSEKLNLEGLKDWDDLDKKAEEVWEEMTYKQKVFAARYVFNAILKNSNKQKSTYRQLIYNELGLGTNSYSLLLPGENINNLLNDYIPKEFLSNKED